MAEAQRQSKVVTTEPVSGVTRPKNWDDWRAIFHDFVAVLVPTLIGMNLVTESQATLWIPFVFAIADPLLSAGNTQDKARRVIYGLVALLQTSSAVVSVFTTDPHIPVMVTGIASVATALFGRFNTPTSTLVPKQRTGPGMNDVA